MPLRVVALGDSETTGSGDPTGAGWVERYARLLRTKRDFTVQVMNLAVDNKTSGELLSDVRSDAETRTALHDADVILLGVGGADYNAGDDRFAARRCRAEACYAPGLRAFAKNFDATVAAIRELRGSTPTAIRSITQPQRAAWRRGRDPAVSEADRDAHRCLPGKNGQPRDLQHDGQVRR
jgi:lysophospholipase L1-like esterase